MGCPRTSLQLDQWAWGRVPALSVPLLSLWHPQDLLSPPGVLRPAAGMHTQHCAAFPQFGGFFSFYPSFSPQPIGREEQHVLRLNPPKQSQGKPSGKLLFVTDDRCGSAWSSHPPITLPSLVSRSFLSSKIQFKKGAWKENSGRIPLFSAVSMPGSSCAVCPACPAVLLPVSRYKSPFHAHIPVGK